MTTALLVRGRALRSLMPPPLTIAAGRQHTAETILRAWYEGKTENTIVSYRHDLEDFAVFLSRALGLDTYLTAPEALARLFQESAPSAHEIALAFRHHLLAANMSPSSINRHLACLRSVTTLGRMLGMMTWAMEVPGLKAERRRDVQGPNLAAVRELLAAMNDDTEADTRDAAIVLTFICLGLRVSELCRLNLEDANLDCGNVWVKGKGRRERELVPVPQPVVDAIKRYLMHRGFQDGPLFQSQRRAKHPDGRLERRSVLRIIRVRGQRANMHLWCHALRHTAITTAIEAGQKAGIGLDQIRTFSRHKSLMTMLIYRDEHDHAATHRTLSDVVANALLPAAKGGAR